jgi:hypothetical protein
MSNDNLNPSLSAPAQSQTERIEIGSTSLEGKMLSGREGQYAIQHQIQNRPGVRTYIGSDLQTHTPVIIKEYYSFWWTISDIQQIELQLEQLEAIDFRSGGVQDFRLLIPQECIASSKDHRCYLVLRAPQHQPRSLRSYLETQDYVPPKVVHHFLSQVLQSLWFLHSLTLYLEDNDEIQKGIAHGNLSLDSILIAADPAIQNTQTLQFQVYLQDLQLWEAAIWHTTQPQIQPAFKIKKQKDLRDLGKIAAQLLLGELDLPEAWNPLNDPRWQDISHDPLKEFIQQLIGLESSTFSGAKAARGWLLSIPAEVEPAPTSSQTDTLTATDSDHELEEDGEESDAPPTYFKVAFAIVFSALILNIGVLWMRGESFKAPTFNQVGNTR